MGISAKKLWPSVSYLLLKEALRLALAVGLNTANVVGCGVLQDLQELLQGSLKRGERWGLDGDWGCSGHKPGPG